MDDILKSITDFACGTSYDDLPDNAVIAAKERLVDTLGCALGALDCDTVAVARTLVGGPPPKGLAGRILGEDTAYAADNAAFVNSCMLRNLDFNDTYPGCHPSDGLGGLFTVAPIAGVSGKDLIVATLISHETIMRHVIAANPNQHGFDQGTAIGMGVAAGVSRLLGLSRKQTAHAISITTVGNMQLRATRSGELSMWKGCATALATRNAVYAVGLARAGMTGPPEPFRGRDGLADHYPSFEWTPYGTAPEDFHIAKANLKFWAVAYQMQAAAWCGIELGKLVNADDVVSINVEANEFAHFESGSEPAKWDPQTKETADHSLPYILAWGLRHGAIGTDAFEPDAYLDPTIRPFLNNINVTVNEEFTNEYPVEMHMRATATDKDGKKHVADIRNPIGHRLNPMSFNEIGEKFVRLAGPALGIEQAADALEIWKIIENSENTAAAFDALKVKK